MQTQKLVEIRMKVPAEVHQLIKQRSHIDRANGSDKTIHDAYLDVIKTALQK